jgi:hypothetical protein
MKQSISLVDIFCSIREIALRSAQSEFENFAPGAWPSRHRPDDRAVVDADALLARYTVSAAIWSTVTNCLVG